MAARAVATRPRGPEAQAAWEAMRQALGSAGLGETYSLYLASLHARTVADDGRLVLVAETPEHGAWVAGHFAELLGELARHHGFAGVVIENVATVFDRRAFKTWATRRIRPARRLRDTPAPARRGRSPQRIGRRRNAASRSRARSPGRPSRQEDDPDPVAAAPIGGAR